jgi:hypothetical protein
MGSERSTKAVSSSHLTQVVLFRLVWWPDKESKKEHVPLPIQPDLQPARRRVIRINGG